jgi:hypothetical protein
MTAGPPYSSAYVVASTYSPGRICRALPGGSQPSVDIALGDIDGDGVIPPVDDHGLPNINILGLLPDLW